MPKAKTTDNIIITKVKGFEIFFNKDSHRFWRMEAGKKVAIPSVTSFTGILDKSQALIPWAIELFADHLRAKILVKEPITDADIYEGSELHRVRKQEAADIGTQAHEWVNQWINGQNPPIPENLGIQRVINSFLEYQDAHQLKWQASEMIVYYNDGEIEYAGILDALAIIKNKLILVDFKSSSGIYNEHVYQAAAYQLAYEWMTDKVISYRMILRFAKETEDEYIERMEAKNHKRRTQGKATYEYPQWVAFEAKEFAENAKDKLAFKACVTLKSRNKELDKSDE